jgi:hypothetical protein
MKGTSFFRASPSFFAISYFQHDRLQVIFVERKEGHFKMMGQESLTGNPEEENDARACLETFQAKSPIWIHLVFRSAAFVKTFSFAHTPHTDFERVLTDRVHSEIPYVPDEVMLQREIQKGREGDAPLVLVTGISKAVLNGEMNQLKRFNIMPDHVMLSTGVLRQFYLRRFASRAHAPCNLMIHESLDHAELLFFKNQSLVQSIWISNDDHFNDSIKASLNAFQREWREKPETLFFTGEISSGMKTLVSDMGLKTEEISSNESGEIPLLTAQTLEAYWSRDFNDFILPEMKVLRDQKRTLKKRLQLIQSAVWLSVSILILSFLQLIMVLTQLAWFSIKNKGLEDSVQELIGVRKQALDVQSFYGKKSMPMLLLAGLRESIPEAIFLKEIKYDEMEQKMTIRGMAPDQAGIDLFVSSLSKGSLFKHLNLQSVQGEQNDQGAWVYRFVIEGELPS